MPYVEFDMNDTGALARLKKIEQRLGNLKPLYTGIGEHLLLRARERFDTTQADPQGAKWRPLSKRYARWKARNYPGKKVLSLGGALKGSLGFKLLGDSVVIGTVKGLAPKYARIHQDGGTIKQKSRTQVNALDERGKFMSRKSAGAKYEMLPGGKRKRRVSTRIHIANIGERTIAIPARPYIGLGDRDRDRIRKDTLKYLVAHEG
jgi:phage gpG-like protein